MARAGNGVCYGFFEQAEEAADWLHEASAKGWKAILEYSPESFKARADLWPAPGGDLELMRRIKQLFDPGNILNRGRLYGRI